MGYNQEPTERVSITLTKETAAKVRRMAKAMGLKQTQFMTFALASATEAIAEAYEHEVKPQVQASFAQHHK